MNNGPIILFDGVCMLCNGLVQFVIRRDPKAKFRFAALQSEAGQTLLKQRHLSVDDLDTFILVDGDRHFERSTAGLRTLWGIGGGWRIFYVLILVPRPFRDWVYNVIARRRYRWFGIKPSCMVPAAEIRARFLYGPLPSTMD